MATAKKYRNYDSIDELPAMMKVKDLAAVMGINENSAYSLVKKNGFPSLKIGKRIMIPREQFKTWLKLESWKNDFSTLYKDLNEANKKLYEQIYWEAIDFLAGKLEVQLHDHDRKQIRHFFK